MGKYDYKVKTTAWSPGPGCHGGCGVELSIKEGKVVKVEGDYAHPWNRGRACPRLLGIVGETGNVILDGYSLPCTALFFAFGMPVRELRGHYPRFIDTLESCALKDITDPGPGAAPFCVRPMHEKPRFFST